MKMYIYLGIILLWEGMCLRLKKQLISPITGHSLWNKIVFVYSFVIMIIANLFSLSCALLCCSSK